MSFTNKHYQDIIDSAKIELDKWNNAPEDFKKRSIERGFDLGNWYTNMIKACEQSMEPEQGSSPEQIQEPEYDGPNEDSKNLAADIQAKLNKAATEEKINMASGAEPTPTPHPKSDDDEWSDDYDKKHEGFEQQAADLKKELGTEGDSNDTGTPYQSREEVPEQARELWDIIHALKDDPHDNRLED